MPTLVPMTMRWPSISNGSARNETSRSREDGGLFRSFDVHLKDREFVAAEAREDVGFAHAGEEALGDGAQELVAHDVSERVVDGLELIEIETQHGEAGLCSSLLHGPAQLVFEIAAIG